MPLKMGKGFEVQVAHPCPNQIWVPPWISPCDTPILRYVTYTMHPTKFMHRNFVIILRIEQQK